MYIDMCCVVQAVELLLCEFAASMSIVKALESVLDHFLCSCYRVCRHSGAGVS